MNHWPFVLAAYLVAIVLTAGLVSWAWRTMRRAELQAELLKRR